VLKEEAVLVDLHVEEVEELLGQDNIVGQGAQGFGLVIIQIPLPPLLVDLLYYRQRDAVHS
jgi:hypothetical protein